MVRSRARPDRGRLRRDLRRARVRRDPPPRHGRPQWASSWTELRATAQVGAPAATMRRCSVTSAARARSRSSVASTRRFSMFVTATNQRGSTAASSSASSQVTSSSVWRSHEARSAMRMRTSGDSSRAARRIPSSSSSSRSPWAARRSHSWAASARGATRDNKGSSESHRASSPAPGASAPCRARATSRITARSLGVGSPIGRRPMALATSPTCSWTSSSAWSSRFGQVTSAASAARRGSTSSVAGTGGSALATRAS
jgi:hypothetical protein